MLLVNYANKIMVKPGQETLYSIQVKSNVFP